MIGCSLVELLNPDAPVNVGTAPADDVADITGSAGDRSRAGVAVEHGVVAVEGAVGSVGALEAASEDRLAVSAPVVPQAQVLPVARITLDPAEQEKADSFHVGKVKVNGLPELGDDTVGGSSR